MTDSRFTKPDETLHRASKVSRLIRSAGAGLEGSFKALPNESSATRVAARQGKASASQTQEADLTTQSIRTSQSHRQLEIAYHRRRNTQSSFMQSTQQRPVCRDMYPSFYKGVLSFRLLTLGTQRETRHRPPVYFCICLTVSWR